VAHAHGLHDEHRRQLRAQHALERSPVRAGQGPTGQRRAVTGGRAGHAWRDGRALLLRPRQRAYDRGPPGAKAAVSSDGLHAVAPAAAPQQVKDAITAANRIVGRPYKYGGGHAQWEDSGYDCSGTVSYALHGAGLLSRSMSSGEFGSWGVSGTGSWITVYYNGGHAYAVIAGLRLDTSGSGGRGPRWHTDMRSGLGYSATHWRGL